MCGRYTLTTEEEELLTFLSEPAGSVQHQPRFNIAPTQAAPVVVQGGGERKIGSLRWGLVPHWADGPSLGNRLINARSETVHTKRAFRDCFLRRRCLVPADGFYEWRREGNRKSPHWIHLRSRSPFTFAGLWDRWLPPQGDPLYTFAILTTDASLSIRHVHDRMPVILTPDVWDEWLEPESRPEELVPLLRPLADGLLEEWEVSTRVNRPEHDDETLIDPLL